MSSNDGEAKSALVVGVAGLLGQDLKRELESRGTKVTGLDVTDLDVTDPIAVAKIAQGVYGQGGWLFNCAAYTNVDQAETDVNAATQVNALAPSYLAQACQMVGKRLLHMSTDFVFDGTASTPYTEDARPNPLGVYARTKLEGEEAVLTHSSDAIVVRTAWLYGPHGKCFPKTILNAWQSGRELKVVTDQIGCPTYTADLARVLVDLTERDAPGGVFHAAGPEVMNWHSFAEMILETWSGQQIAIKEVVTEDWPTPAVRPKYSVLSFDKCSSLGIEPMRPVREALSDLWTRVRQMTP